MLKHGILGLIRYGDMTGYQIMVAFRDSLNYFWSAQTSQIYRELQVLKDKGWVSDRLVEQTGKPDKRVFSITEEGQEELVCWLREDKADLDSNNPLLMRVFFKGALPAGENIAFFERLKEECDEYQSRMPEAGASADRYAAHRKGSPDAVYWRMTIRYGVRYIEMLKEWCDECIKELEESNESLTDQRKS